MSWPPNPEPREAVTGPGYYYGSTLEVEVDVAIAVYFSVWCRVIFHAIKPDQKNRVVLLRSLLCIFLA
jgi:hypothetical protein